MCEGATSGRTSNGESRLGLFTRAFRLAEAELAPAGVGLLDVVLVWPDGRRKAGAAVVRIGVVVEIHGGVDQHPAPFAGAEQRGIAVALAHRRVEPQAEGRGHD